MYRQPSNMSFKGKTVFITGGSRGIGKVIGIRLAQEGANVIFLALRYSFFSSI